MSKDISNVSDYFPHQDIGAIAGRPTYVRLLPIRDKLVANAAAIPSTLGGGAHGHSGLVLSDATYHRETGHHFTVPAFPGAVASVPNGTVSLAERNIREKHASDLKQYNLCNAISNALKKIIINVIDDEHLEALNHAITGYANVEVHQMVSHLFKTYGRFTSGQLDGARAKAGETWDPSVPIQSLFSKIKKCADLLEAAEEPLSDKQMVRYGYDAVLKTGCFSDEMKKWRRKDPTDKTWVLFKVYMAKEYDDHLEDVEAGTDQFNSANSAVQDETLGILKDLAFNASSDRENLANLSEANVTLQTLVTTLKTSLSKIEGQLTNVSNRLTALEKKNPTATAGGGTEKKKFYCWTCGVNWNHGSKLCTVQKPNHDRTAWWRDRKGGNETDNTL